MTTQHKDLAQAKAKTVGAMLSLLAVMKGFDFHLRDDAAAIEEAFSALSSALRLLNGGAP